VTGFKAFLMKGNLVQLAVAFVMGLTFATLIQSVVGALFSPLILAIVGKPTLNTLYFTINHAHFQYGQVINAAITFVLTAAVLYFVIVVPYQALVTRTQRLPDPTTKQCPECLSEIPLGASRCAFCTAAQPALN